MTTSTSIFPIRHHGPGSARSLEHALTQLQPDIVLVEGPADADGVLPFLARKEMEPPVALLGYVNDDPARASFWPFAAFSPEFVAFRWAAQAGAQARFMDLPAGVTLAGERDDGEENDLHSDPLRLLAEAAGYADFERWWETLVEARGDGSFPATAQTNRDRASGSSAPSSETPFPLARSSRFDGTTPSNAAFDVFGAVLEAMQAVRADAPAATGREAQREAHMRQTIRTAIKDGFQRIAVVCGAWHAPVLDVAAFRAKDDAALLKGLLKAKVTLTWVPWTHGRLSVDSGYGAGVRSPGYYHHLFTTHAHVTERWFARAARLLREERLEASSAGVIEATRLANTLAALRGRALPGLDELNEAALSVFGWDGDLPLRLIEQKLVVGEALGRVPDDTPTVPLAQDLARLQKRLRLKVQPEQSELTLDLRQDTDLARSALFHRLKVLGVPWAQERYSGGRGTFKEAWALAWKPEYSVRLVEASRFGQTVEDAAIVTATEAARTSGTLADLTALLEVVRYADLGAALPPLLTALDARAAGSADVSDLLAALPPLARLARYGDVRGRAGAGDERAGATFRTLLTRAGVGLPLAGVGLDPGAAETLRGHVQDADGAVRLLGHPEALSGWHGALARVADRDDTPPLLAGDALRRLRDAGQLEGKEVERRLELALSSAAPLEVTAWLDGFLGHSGALLTHDAALLALLDGWLTGLSPDAFQQTLPLLRRVFSRFERPERRAIGERLRGGHAGARQPLTPLNEERALRAVPVALRMLGGGS